MTDDDTPTLDAPEGAVPEPSPEGGAATTTAGGRRQRSADASASPRAVLGCVAVVAVVAVAVGAWFTGLGVLAVAESLVRGWVEVWIVVPAAGIPLLLAARHRGSARRRWTALAVVTGLLAMGYAVGVHGWLVATKYSDDVRVEDTATDYLPRAPWVVADNYAAREQGEIVGDRLATHYVPDTDADGTTSRYSVLVERRAPLGLAGLEAVQELRTPVTGTVPGSASGHCTVPQDMGLRPESFWPWHSLRQAIALRKPFAHWNTEDVYGYCDGQRPVVVVPLWAYDGWFVVTRRPDGAAVYDAAGVRILPASELKTIDGPTYPRTLAEEQRTALRGDGTLTGYWSSATGYDTTDKDEEDANEGNVSEFTLVSGDGALAYVTPLTPRGTSESMTAVSIVPARQSAPVRAPLVVNTSTDLPATSTLATRIKEASVQGDTQWTNRWAAGMRVYEILPAEDGHWVASIGQGQAVSYRADISPNGSVRVVNVETGAATTGGDTASGAPRPNAGNLSTMSRQELLDLLVETTRELQRREQAGTTG